MQTSNKSLIYPDKYFGKNVQIFNGTHTPIECFHFCYRLDSSLIILEPRLVKKRGHEDKCLLTLGRPHWHLCGYVHMSNCFRRHFSKSILTIPYSPRQKLHSSTPQWWHYSQDHQQQQQQILLQKLLLLFYLLLMILEL